MFGLACGGEQRTLTIVFLCGLQWCPTVRIGTRGGCSRVACGGFATLKHFRNVYTSEDMVWTGGMPFLVSVDRKCVEAS